MTTNQSKHSVHMSPSAEPLYRVGYWWSEKKSQKLNATELAALFAERSCQLIKIDLEQPIEDQGPFSLIVHKVSDIMVRADQGEATAKKIINSFESYSRKHPETIILDPLNNSRALLDRYKQYRLIEQSDLAKDGVVFTPPFIHLTSTNIDVNRGRIKRSKMTFPIVCKPILAQGSTGAHQMCIIFNEAGLKDIKPPCVAQSFVNHNAKLFKLFVIKDRYYVTERPSLKNFNTSQDHETVFFFSHDISKPNSSSSLTELDEKDRLELENMLSMMHVSTLGGFNEEPTTATNLITSTSNTVSSLAPSQPTTNTTSITSPTRTHEHKENVSPPQHNGKMSHTTNNNDNLVKDIDHTTNVANHQQYPHLMPTDKMLSKIVKTFSEKLGLTFYGLDIIIEHKTSRYAIIDMNTFPGYDGVDNFLSIFRDVVCDAIPKTDDQLSCNWGANNNTTVTNTTTVTTTAHNNSKDATRRKITEIDSGIEST